MRTVETRPLTIAYRLPDGTVAYGCPDCDGDGEHPVPGEYVPCAACGATGDVTWCTRCGEALADGAVMVEDAIAIDAADGGEIHRQTWCATCVREDLGALIAKRDEERREWQAKWDRWHAERRAVMAKGLASTEPTTNTSDEPRKAVA